MLAFSSFDSYQDKSYFNQTYSHVYQHLLLTNNIGLVIILGII